MKTKNNKISGLRILSVALLLSATLGSCTGSHEDIFEQNPSERLEERLQEVKNQLVSSEDGWILELASAENANNGAFVVGLKFNDAGWVRAYSEASLANASSGSVTSYASQYVLTKDAGVVISFREYNEALHYYSTPDRSIGAGFAKGFQADYEFRVMESSSPDTLHLIGKKTKNEILMYRHKGSLETYIRTASSMRTKLQQYLDENVADQYKLISPNSTDTLTLELGASNYRYFTKEVGNETLHAPIVYTDKGFRFLTAQGGASTTFTFDDTNKQFVSSAGDKLVPSRSDVYEDYASYLGEYLLGTYFNQEEVFDIALERGSGLVYNVTGLSYPMKARYNKQTKQVEFYPQDIFYQIDGKSQSLMLVNVDLETGSLTANPEIGLILTKSENSTEENAIYRLAPNPRLPKLNTLVLVQNGSSGFTIYRDLAPTAWKDAILIKK